MPIIPGWATRVAAHALHEAAALPLARVVVRCSRRRDPLARRRGPPARGCFRTPEGPGMVRIGKTLLIVILTFGWLIGLTRRGSVTAERVRLSWISKLFQRLLRVSTAPVSML